MKTQQAYVNPKMLRWGRESAGYSVDEVAAKIALKTVTAETVQDWESGEKRLLYTQLETLSKYYQRPIAIFFAPKPPWEEKLDRDFRSLPSQYVDEIPPSIRFAIRSARVKQLDLAELYNSTLPSFSWLEKVRPKIQHVPETANYVREQLKVSFSEQKSWGDASEALRKWREKVENLGLWVFKDSFKDKGYDGFYLPDQKFPVIYLNSSKSHKRQIFTLFHELGHFLLREGGICFRSDFDEQELQGEFKTKEVFCNAFAGEFLVSAEELKLTRMLTEDEIKDYAKAYNVSREVILRKCKDRGFIDWNGYAATVADWNEYAAKVALRKKAQQQSKESGGPSYYVKQRSYLGLKFLELAFSQYYQQRISESQLANYLGVSEKSLVGLESTIYKK